MTDMRRTTMLYLGAALFVLVLIPWGPYLGVNTGVIDSVRFISNASQSTFFINPGRSFETVPWRAAHWLTPDSMLGTQWLIIGFQTLSALALFDVLVQVRIPERLPIPAAVVAVLLYAVHAADPGTVWIANLGPFWGTFTMLLSIAFFLRFCRTPSLWLALGVMVPMAMSLNIHERYYGLVPLVPLLAYRDVVKRPAKTLVVWFLVPVIQGLRLFILLTRPDAAAYQVGTLADDGSLLVTLFWAVVTSVRMVAVTLAVPLPATTSWVQLAAAGAAGGVAFVTAMMFLPRRVEATTSTVRFALGGIAVIVMGFAPYAITDLRVVTQRTLLLSIIGAAVVYAVLLWTLWRAFRVPRAWMALTVGILVALHIHVKLAHQEHYRQQAVVVQQQGEALIGAVGEVPQDHVLWAVHQEDTPLLIYWLTQAQLTYLYEHRIFVCVEKVGMPGLFPYCEVTGDGVLVLANRAQREDILVPFSEMVVIQISGESPGALQVEVVEDLAVTVAEFPPDAQAIYQPYEVITPYDTSHPRYQNHVDYRD